MKFFVKPIIKDIQYVSFDKNGKLSYRFKDSLSSVYNFDFDKVKNRMLSCYKNYSDYANHVTEALRLKEDIVLHNLQMAVEASRRHVAPDDIIKLNPKYGNLSKGRVVGAGLLYKAFSLEPIDEFCVEVVLLKKDGSDSQIAGFVTNTGFILYKPRKVVNVHDNQLKLPLTEKLQMATV